MTVLKNIFDRATDVLTHSAPIPSTGVMFTVYSMADPVYRRVLHRVLKKVSHWLKGEILCEPTTLQRIKNDVRKSLSIFTS